MGKADWKERREVTAQEIGNHFFQDFEHEIDGSDGAIVLQITRGEIWLL